MELLDSLTRISSRIPEQLPLLATEEATKNALVMPLINALGYNVFDPLEVVPEFTADVGIKKGEKVDYAIMIDGKPMILIECKTAGTSLDLKHASQLYRYFSVTEARFAVLTDGIDYRFYTDLSSPNRMDETPFFDFSMQEVDGGVANELRKYVKGAFDLDNILSGASDLKYRKHLQRLISDEYERPSDELVRLFASKVYKGRFTTEVREQFAVLVRGAFREFVRAEVSGRLKYALAGTDTDESVQVQAEEEESGESLDGIVTTAEEIEGFHVVRAVVSQVVDPSRVVMRDTKSYCGILLDDNNRKPICRLRFNRAAKYVGIFDAQKNETKCSIERPADLYHHADAFRQTIQRYESSETSDPVGPTDTNCTE